MSLSILIEVVLMPELITTNNFWHCLISQVTPVQAADKVPETFYKKELRRN